ncbi:glycosyltransferase family 2 protein [Ruminococcus sp.]|uniref:glycosyltransferase family 2 protein n=1 Tax=Ruminococcus sp. TaxID=41978 RepID=UPI0025E29405|nr:glycosyltransferase family 2 protein [Ruminococcus sp.]MBR1432844.1 glycosyltransferase family 2 protein [Ruminococcus sp.]
MEKVVNNIAAGIVTYNPDLKRLKENIGSIKPQVKQLLIVDNGSTNIEEIEALCKENKCELINFNENKGIAYALNKICEFFSSNYEWVLTLDQDSISPKNLIQKLCTYTTSKIGAIGPKIVYRGNEKFTQNSNKTLVSKVDWLITSATLTNINAWKSIGGFDNKLFIDGVDKDFCFRLNKKGYDVLQCNEVELYHELGNLKCRRVFGKTIYVTNHSPKRKYYMARNAIYLDKKNGTHLSVTYIIKLFIKTLLFENGKKERLHAIAKGVRDAKKL